MTGAVTKNGAGWFKKPYHERMSVNVGASGMLKFASQLLIYGLVGIPPYVEAHEISVSPAELEFLLFECDALSCAHLQELVGMPERVLYIGVVE